MQSLSLYIDRKRLSPYAMSVFVALREKHVDFKEIKIDLDKDENKSDTYLRICKTGKIPCLSVDGWSIFESMAITEFLDELFPAPDYPALYPTAIRARAKCRAVQALLKSDFSLICQNMPSTGIFQPLPEPYVPDRHTQVEIDRLTRVSEALIGDQWLSSQWSIADFDLAFMLHRLLSFKVPISERLYSYVMRNFQRESVHVWFKLRELERGTWDPSPFDVP